MIQISVTDFNNQTYDFTKRFQRASYERMLNDASSILNVNAKNIERNHVLHRMNVFKEGTPIFNGVVKEQTDFWQGIKFTQFETVDQIDVIHNRLVAEIFDPNSAEYGNATLIIKTLFQKYAPGITTNNVNDIDTFVDAQAFDYISLFECLQQLSEITDAYFYLDEDNDLHFFQGNDGPLGFEFTEDRYYVEDFEVVANATRIANRIWVFGARQPSQNEIEQTYTTDGVNRYFSIAGEPNNLIILQDGEEKEVLPESSDDGAADFLYNRREKYFYIPQRYPIPNKSTIMAIYNPTIEIVDFVEDIQSIRRYGLYEKAIKDRTITDKPGARKRARSELRRISQARRVVRVQTKHWDKLEIGKVTRIVNSKLEIDSRFMITRIRVFLEPNNIRATFEAEEVIR